TFPTVSVAAGIQEPYPGAHASSPQRPPCARGRPDDCPAVGPYYRRNGRSVRPGNRARGSQQRRMEAGAVGEILGIARFKFHEGKVEEYKRLSTEAMEIVRTKDSETLQFDTYLNDDESECMVIERYRDSAAA